MQKRIFSLLFALMMLLCCAFAQAEDMAQDVGEALTLTELEQWVEGYKTRALSLAPQNDPTAEAAFSEDGYAFIYDFGTLYLDQPQLTEDSVVRNLVITAEEEAGPRGAKMGMTPHEVMAGYYNENPSLAGDHSFAGLYLSNLLPEGAHWAWVQRDGQRIMTIQYAVQELAPTGGDGYTDTGLLFTFSGEGVLTHIRAYNLDSRVTEATVTENAAAVQEVMETTYYVHVPSSTVGTDLDPFQPDDLHFEGLDFLTMTPDTAVEALGACLQDTWMQDEGGDHYRTMEFESCEISFRYDSAKQNPVVDVLSVNMDGFEGPRYVRIGDMFHTVHNRFRYGEGEFDGETREVLYGEEGVGSWGVATYNDDGTYALRYGFDVGDGRQVVLSLYFETLHLSEILIYVQ